MLKQYLEVKAQCPDKILFFRLGDFYEMFNDDALTASRELDLTLTGRGVGNKERVPMCGVPFHSADTYIERLVHKGYKVAICEQMEDPKTVKGIVKRKIIKVITPGTITLENAVASKKNNYISCVCARDTSIAVALMDVTTGECLWSLCNAGAMDDVLFDIFSVYEPSELIYAHMDEYMDAVQAYLRSRLAQCAVTPFAADNAVDYEAVAVRYFGAEAVEEAKGAAACIGMLLTYVGEVMQSDIGHINSLERIDNERRLVIDAASLRHLEITQNVRDGGRKGTLLSILDKTKTAMGGRLLRKWLEAPLVRMADITMRQDAVEDILSHEIMRQDLADTMDRIYDFERILTRIETGTASPKDLVALRESLAAIPQLRHILEQADADLLKRLRDRIQTHDDMYDLLCRSIKDEPGLVIRNGGVIRDGYSAELDEIRSIAANSKAYLKELEEQEKEKTGIKMKIGYTKVFGYYFEISHANTKPIPDYYVRKQTLVNAERYITPALKEFEVKVLTSQERMLELEYQLFGQLRKDIQGHIREMQQTARAIARVDCLYSLACAAHDNHYIRPGLNTKQAVQIKDGRHPIIEKFLKDELFVPNDVTLNHSSHEILVITGPNMAGKSTYMRQVAVLVLMAQTGSFIPAREASICPVDRIFTRIGASDDILSGQSTFMVKMKEVSYILSHATERSLLVLDEIGRGTSTFDGMSIARAVIEYCLKHIHALTLFATHYHELTDMADTSEKIKNYTVAVKERGKNIKFLRRIIPGGADRSYGLHVARLAGLPESLLKRADVILSELESQGAVAAPVPKKESRPLADSLFTDPVLERLLSVDVSSMTPIEAISFLYSLQKEAKEGSGMN
ncbi:DNA mismatch repair protein MutS [Megasphaera sp. SW808]|uniref:DNA mismatch repair protein MutS n=1 Tax=Megasphaera sp. SW808 TaxID=2530045 RepID=UPI001439080F|nr:DNA mismatch repair protein MutS [Megasphaera sp. SW808]NJE34712.1 DNA mismatch repair protein MutS [Megasphaera sp. SW808]